MRTRTCPECGDTFTAWTDAKRLCGGLVCTNQQTAPDVAARTMRIVGLRRGNWRRSALDIQPPTGEDHR